MSYDKNFQSLSKKLPLVGQMIEKLPDIKEGLGLSRDEKENFTYQWQERKQTLHSNYSVVKESQKWLDSMDLTEAKVLLVYGLGMGHLYKELKEWLKGDPERYLVFLEDNPLVFKAWLHSQQAEEMLADEQVKYSFCGLRELDSEVITDLAVYFINMPFHFTCLPHYHRIKKERFESLQGQFLRSTAYVRFASQELMDHGCLFFRQYYQNLPKLLESYCGSDLFGKFTGVPAIVCGAGPSLDRNGSYLKKLQDRALIFAGGSSINALTNRGITPHLASVVDPNDTQLERSLDALNFEIPVFFKTRVNHGALSTLHGRKLYLSGNNCYPITTWVDEQLGIPTESIQEGHSVLHLNLELARLLGCNPILVVGADLSYPGLKLYADGVVKQNQMSREDLTQGGHINKNAYQRTDIKGEPVYTLWKWITESQYVSQWAADHPSVKLINCTEGGLGFEGIPNMDLNEAAEIYLRNQLDPGQRVHAEISQAKLPELSTQNLIEMHRKIKGSLDETADLTERIISLINKQKKALKKRSFDQLSKHNKELVELNQSLEEEVAFQQIIQPVTTLHSLLHERKMDQLGWDQNIASEETRLLQGLETSQAEMRAYRQCTKVNLIYLRHLKEGLQSSANDQEEVS